MAYQALKSIIIDYLGVHSALIPIVAQWHQDEWSHISPDLTTELRINLYKTYSNTPSIPHCLIALQDAQPAGSASLVTCDMDNYSHFSPWLASVFVRSEYRCEGIASKLIQQCLKNARTTGIKTVYLFTPDQIDFYLKRGWTLIEHCQYHNEEVDIMSYDTNQLQHL